jgi:hypothetical protein
MPGKRKKMTYQKTSEIAERNGIKGQVAIINALEFVEELLRMEAEAMQEAVMDGKSIPHRDIEALERAASVVSNLAWDDAEIEEDNA